MDPVVAVGELEGLAEMMAALIRGNVEARPELAGLVKGTRGDVSITARDVGATVGISFKNGRVEVSNALPGKADVAIEADADGLMAFSTVPLKFGMPDVMTPEGRDLAKQVLKRHVVVRGMVRHPRLLRHLQKIMTVT